MPLINRRLTMIGLAEGCRWIEPKFIEDEEVEFEFVATVLLDRWGDRRVPKQTAEPSWFDGHRGFTV